MPLIRYEQHHSIPKSLLREVILDFGAYVDFIPQVRSCRVNTVGKGVWEVDIKIFVIRPLSYRIRMEEKEEGHLVWDLLEGVFTINRGFWKLEESEEGCLVQYEVELQLGTFLPSIIIKKVEERAIPDLISAFVCEAKQRLSAQLGNDQADN
jgi:ribosome-associated toxin RatA of RatAB toxin-antitoxin module